MGRGLSEHLVVLCKCRLWVLGAGDKNENEKCLEGYKEEKRKVKRCIYKSKKEVHEQFGRKMIQDVNRNRKLFWKEISPRMEEKWSITTE